MNWVEIKYTQGRKSLHRGQIHERERERVGRVVRIEGKRGSRERENKRTTRGIFVWKKTFNYTSPIVLGPFMLFTHKKL